jgi:hypothetical protein
VPRYLLSIYQPDEGALAAAVLADIGGRLRPINEDLRESGSWVFTGGLHAASTSTVVRPAGAVTDGPYLEGKEHIGGVYVIETDDLDAALDWGRRVADATTLPVEVRPFRDVPDY